MSNLEEKSNVVTEKVDEKKLREDLKLKLKKVKNYGKVCVERLAKKGVEITKSAVYQTARGFSSNPVIIEELSLIVIEAENKGNLPERTLELLKQATIKN